MKRRLLLSPDGGGGGGGGGANPPERQQQQQQQQKPKDDPMAKLAEMLGVKPDADPGDFLAAAQGLKDRIAQYDTKAREQAAVENLIGEKTRAGLSREQAIGVIKRQAAHDKAVEAVWAERRPRIIEVLQACKCKTGTVTDEARAQIRKISPAIVLNEIVAAQKSLEPKAAK